MDEITKSFKKNIKDIEEKETVVDEVPLKRKFSVSLGPSVKKGLMVVIIVAAGCVALSSYVDRQVAKALAKHDAGRTPDQGQLDVKINSAINNYNTQIQAQLMDLQSKVTALQAPAAAVETAQNPPPAPAKKPVANAKKPAAKKTAKAKTSKRAPASKKKSKKKK